MKGEVKFFIIVICAIIVFSSLWTSAEHVRDDPATITASNLYTGTCYVSGFASGTPDCVQGTITILDHFNNQNITITPGCDYYKVGMSVTIHTEWNDITGNHAGPAILNPVTGCHGWDSNRGSPQ